MLDGDVQLHYPVRIGGAPLLDAELEDGVIAALQQVDYGGGIAEPPDYSLDSPPDARGSTPNTIVLAEASVGAALLLAAGGWYSTRRWRGR